ncbi:flagellar protein FlgN [Novosphingobium sp. 1949]|uniref:Flagellar protein FlgN n=1 Tax=Novosphingobium organovorum TaxID=2930092 RepID=A0ABT0BIP8_9SPHN|nr:flagellar protein FlgN [Novosphingobium organovorum]MCJ2184937.1 flagellar protein FlgN [Novosphingobium organovorum]
MTTTDLQGTLRQMLAVLESERQALAGLDLDGIIGATGEKDRLCGRLDALGTVALDEECRGMLDTARRLNEINRQVRNILAANVTKRLDALTGSPQLYRTAAGYAVAGARL